MSDDNKRFQVGSGNKVFLYVALLPLKSRKEPQNVRIQATADFSSGPDSTLQGELAVSALDGDIAAGSIISFGNFNTQTQVKAILDKDAKEGDASLGLTILPESQITDILTGATTDYIAKLRLLGGTSLSPNINANRVDSLVFEDALGYSDGVITSQSWELGWTANLLPTDEAFRRVYYQASRGTSGRELYLWQYDPAPAGFTQVDGLKGAAVATGVSKDLPSDGIITFNCTFTGQGSPTILRYE